MPKNQKPKNQKPKNTKPKNAKPKDHGPDTSIKPARVAIVFFLAGCAAELYLLIVSRFYVNGTMRQVVAWDQYLPTVGWAGLGVAVVGAAWLAIKRKDWIHRSAAGFTAGCGAYVALISFLARWNMSTLSLFSVLVPACALLGILWCLYDRESALPLTAMGFAIIGAWLCYRGQYSGYTTAVKVVAVLYVVLLAATVCVIHTGKPIRILPERADPLPVYAFCALAAAGMLASLANADLAYYVMWGLALVTFGMAVYYTVKQM